MLQQFKIGDLVHNIKTDELGTIEEIVIDTAHSPRYKVALPKLAAHPTTHDVVWDESDLIHSSHKSSAGAV